MLIALLLLTTLASLQGFQGTAVSKGSTEQAKMDAAQESDPCTPPHALIAAVHSVRPHPRAAFVRTIMQQGAPSTTSHRTPLVLSINRATLGEGDASRRTSPPTIYCTPRLQLHMPATAPRSVLLQLEVPSCYTMWLITK